MSLADKFLKESPIKTTSTSTVNRRPVGSPERVNQRIEESRVKGKLKQGETTFTEGEVKVLQKIVEKAERDPFNTSMSMDTDDLSRLGLQASGEGDGADNYSSQQGGGNQGDDNARLDTKEDKLPVTMALTSPDNTPGGDEPIPPEVLASMEVLNQSGEEQQVQPQRGSGELPTTVGDAFGQNQVQQDDVEGENTPTRVDPEEDNESESDNGILAAFESGSVFKNPLDTFNESQEKKAGGDYMAKASAAIMGGGDIEDFELMEEDTVEAASHNVSALMEQMRGGKQAGEKPQYRPKPNAANALDSLGETVSQEAKAKYADKMGALL